MTGNSKVKGKMGKLIKNDFLASARIIPLFYILEAISIVLFYIGDKTQKPLPLGLGVAFTMIVAFLLIFISLFFVVYDFNKSLFSQQGYLSFSLPVTSKQLLGSKMIVYGGWMILSYLVFTVVMAFTGQYVSMDVVGEENMNMVETFLYMFMPTLPPKSMLIIYLIYYVANFFIIVLLTVSMIYFSIAASHMRPFQKHNVIFAVIIFVAVAVAFGILLAALNKFFRFDLAMYDNGSFGLAIGADPYSGNYVALMPVFGYIAYAVALFFGTSYIMHKKVNIK